MACGPTRSGEPRTGRSPFVPAQGALSMGTAKLLRGFGAGPAPGATAGYCSSRAPVIGAAGFAVAFPAFSQPCFLDRARGRAGSATSPIYFFFFFAAFLAFLFFAITSLHQRLKKQA